ncbi:type II secretion system F family protein [Candidatus Woesearchaeota archaeon]|nr:type II secretion system F family protein [Candidatus Woesearchaeota archaeon]
MKILYSYEFGRAFVPKSVRPNLRRYLLKAGINTEPYSFFGLMFYAGLFISIMIHIMFIYPYMVSYKGTMPDIQYLFFTGISTFFIVALMMLLLNGLIIVFIYLALDIKIFNRTRKMEEILPDFFEVVSANLKGGLAFERALWMAIKPKFGILSNEIAMAAKKVMTGHDVDEALREFAGKYDSPMLRRSMDLIISELREGGKISDIIGNIVYDLKKTKELKAEMSASVLAYILFISIIVIIISPILFSLSLNLLEVIQHIMGLLSGSAGAQNSPMGFAFSSIALDPNHFVYFSHVALGVIAIFASMIVSIIEKGSIKGGIKYIPIYLAASQAFYFISVKVMGVIFGNLINF